MKPYLKSIIVIAGFILGSCATNDPHQQAKTGAVIGAIAGAVLGHQLDDDSGRYVGAVIGGMTGAAIGNYMDEQEREFHYALEQEEQRHEIEIERLRDNTLKLSLDSEVSFDFDRSEIKPSFRRTLDKLANVLLKYERTVVHVVGHTDNVGSVEYNARLSQRRADTVARYLIDRNVSRSRVHSEGRGESEPRDTNSTEAGRQLNRRVEIYVKPVEKGNENRAHESPRY
jgi:outer membrane protein OmpA-like peptidoglycan-associated protein